MTVRGLLAHTALEFNTAVRDRSLLLMTYLFPLGFYAFMGLFMGKMNPPFLEIMIAGMAVIAMLSASMFSIPGPLISARESGVLRSYKVNGVPGSAIVGVPAVTTVVHLMIVGAIIAITAPLFFDGRPLHSIPAFLLVMVVASCAHAALGSLIGVVSANTRISVLWSQLLFLPSMMLAGVVVPLEQIPTAFQPVSLLLPATYAMEAFSGLALGLETTVVAAWTAIGALTVGTIVAVVLALLCYSWDEHGSGRRIHPAFAALALVPYAVVFAVFSG